MYKNFLVPLDGSELAECALNHVKKLIQGGGLQDVTLLNVVKVDIPLADEFQKPIDINSIREQVRIVSEKYLADTEARLAMEGIRVKTKVLEGNKPAHAITDYAKENGMDMIIMATHGYGGMKRLMLGSVALGVLHESHMPVLLIRPEACRI
jgi:nucleotide-binding universal stress UspA family protein